MIRQSQLPFLLVTVLFITLGARCHGTTLRELLPEMLDRHDLIKTYQEKKRAAGFLVNQRRAGFYPSIDLIAQGGYESIDKDYSEDSDLFRIYNTIRLTQLVTDFGATSATVDKAELFSRRAEFELAAIQQQVLLAGIKAYINLIRSRDRLQYAKRSVDNIQRQVGFEKALVEKGAGLNSDVLQVKAKLARTKAAMITMQGELEQAKNRFYTIFGQEVSAGFLSSLIMPKAPRSMLPSSLAEAQERARQDNPQLALYRTERELAEKEAAIRNSVYFPRLELVGEGTYRHNDDGVEGVRTDAYVGLELSYNLFRGGADQALLYGTRAERASARHKYADELQRLQENVRNSWQGLAIAEERTKIVHEQALLAVQYLEAARKERKMKTRSLLDLLYAETEFYIASSNAAATQADLEIAVYSLFYVLGMLNEQIITEPETAYYRFDSSPTQTIVIHQVVAGEEYIRKSMLARMENNLLSEPMLTVFECKE